MVSVCVICSEWSWQYFTLQSQFSRLRLLKLRTVQCSPRRLECWTNFWHPLPSFIPSFYPPHFARNHKICQKTIESKCTSVSTAWLPAIWPSSVSKPVANIDGHRHLRSAGRGQLDVPWVRLSTYGGRVFCYAGPSAWNALPDFLKQEAQLPQRNSASAAHVYLGK